MNVKIKQRSQCHAKCGPFHMKMRLLWLVWCLSLESIHSLSESKIKPLKFRSRLISSSNFEKLKIKEVPCSLSSLITCGIKCANFKHCSQFLADQGKCHLLENVPIQEDSSTVNETQIEIHELVDEEWSQVMLIGGVLQGMGYTDNVEVLDLKTMKQCPDPAKLPRGQFKGSAFVIGNQISYAMGHYPNFDPVMGTVQLDLEANQWTLNPLQLPELSYAAVAQIRESWVLIIGGKDSAATFMVYENRSVVSGPSLPHVMSRHCGIGIDKDHIFIAGGDEPDNTFVLKWSEQVWIPQAPMISKQQIEICEKFSDKNNDISILVGNKKFNIFSWSTRSWRPGPTMLDNIGWGEFSRYDGIPYLFGGQSSKVSPKSFNIYAFNPRTETWSKTPLQLKNGRASYGIVKIPPGIAKC